MFCTQCGKQVGQVKFCPNCGSAADGGETTLQGEVSEAHEVSVDDALKRAKGVFDNTVGDINKINLGQWGGWIGLAYGLMGYSKENAGSFLGLFWHHSLRLAMNSYYFSDYFLIFILFPAVGTFIGYKLQKNLKLKR